jgi:acyl-homoserine lactone acylase PvdQ
MSLGNDSLSTAVESAKEHDLKPLAEASAEALALDRRQLAEMENYLHAAWFFGVRTGHTVMVETKMGQSDPTPVILGMQDEFQDLMERCAEALNTTVGSTIQAWNYLGEAWIAGARFWEVEIAARVIEAQAGGFDDPLRQLGETD